MWFGGDGGGANSAGDEGKEPQSVFLLSAMAVWRRRAVFTCVIISAYLGACDGHILIIEGDAISSYSDTFGKITFFLSRSAFTRFTLTRIVTPTPDRRSSVSDPKWSILARPSDQITVRSDYCNLVYGPNFNFNCCAILANHAATELSQLRDHL